jgi:hypothetical protein
MKCRMGVGAIVLRIPIGVPHERCSAQAANWPTGSSTPRAHSEHTGLKPPAFGSVIIAASLNIQRRSEVRFKFWH